MGFGALRNIIRPLSLSSSRTLTLRISAAGSTTPFHATFASLKSELGFLRGGSAPSKPHQWLPFWNYFHSLTDTRYPKRRLSDKSRRKRASLRPRGPYAWVQYALGEPILPNKPSEGNVRRRNEKKTHEAAPCLHIERKKRKAKTG